jgi:radical SAM superfamily enzyme YgiQ (UPF0313 family)
MDPPNNPDNKGWIERETKHNGYNRIGINSYTVASLYALLKRDLPSKVKLHHIDGRIDNLDYKSIKKKLDKIKPDLVVVFIGAFTINNDKQYLEYDYPVMALMTPSTISVKEAHERFGLKADYYTKEEIEFTVLKAIQELISTKKIEKTPGMIINKNGKMVDTGEPVFESFKKLPVPDFETTRLREYYLKQKEYYEAPVFHIMTQIGCPFSCIFCNQNKAKVQEKSPKQVIEELKAIKKAGFRHFSFINNEFAINKENAKEVCRLMIKENLGMKWRCQNRVEFADDELYSLMAKSGCDTILYGIESFDPAVKKRINKSHSIKHIYNAMNLTKKYGMTIGMFLIWGLPGETKKTFRLNLKHIKKINPGRLMTSVLFLTPSTKLYEDLKAQNRIVNFDWENYKLTKDDIFIYPNGKSRSFYFKRNDEFLKLANNHRLWLRLLRKPNFENFKNFVVIYLSTTEWFRSLYRLVIKRNKSLHEKLMKNLYFKIPINDDESFSRQKKMTS